MAPKDLYSVKNVLTMMLLFLLTGAFQVNDLGDLSAGWNIFSIAAKYTTVGIALILILFSLNNLEECLKGLSAQKSLLLILVWALVSILWSEQRSVSIIRYVEFFTVSFCAIYIGTTVPLDRFLRLIKMSFKIILVLSILFTLGNPDSRTAIMGPEDNVVAGWRSIYFHKNSFGMNMLISSLIFTLSTFFENESKKRNLPWLVLSVFFLAMSRSIGSLGSFIVVIMLIAFWHAFSFARGKIACSFMVTLIVLLPFIMLSGVFDPILAYFGKSSDLSGRKQLWSLLLTFLDDRLILGFGFNGFWSVGTVGKLGTAPSALLSELSSGTLVHAHNSFFQVIIDMGIIGLLFTFTLMTGFFNVAHSYLKKSCSGLRYMPLAFFFMTLLLCGTENVLFKRNLIWFMIVYCLIATRKAKRSIVQHPELNDMLPST